MMAEHSNQMLLDGLETPEQSTSTAMEWLARSYESMEQWKRTGKELFFSLNGQSDVARNRLAAVIRKYFVETPPNTEDVRRWKRDSTEQETIRVTPPKISASNSAYVDWGYLADYVLLACAAVSEELEEENQKRALEYRQLFDSYSIRLAVFDARTIIRTNAELNDDDALTQLKMKHEKAAAAHVKEARKLERNAVRYAPPKPPTESPEMNRYVPLYF